MTMPIETTVTIRGMDCFAYSWSPVGDAVKPKGLAVIYHGFLAHANFPTVRYAAEFLAEAGFAVIAADMPGHGKSPGLRGYLESAEVTTEDGVAIARFALQQVRTDKVFLVGSSMGGSIALSVAESLGQGSVAGVVLLAPMLKLNVSDLEHGLLNCLSFVVPKLQAIPSSSTDSEKQCRDPRKREECDNDPLIAKASSIRIGSALTCVDMTRNVAKKFVQVTCPFLLLVADEDVVVKNEGSEDLYAKSPSTDKTKKHYKALHALLCEPSPLFDEIRSDILDWMSARTG